MVVSIIALYFEDIDTSRIFEQAIARVPNLESTDIIAFLVVVLIIDALLIYFYLGAIGKVSASATIAEIRLESAQIVASDGSVAVSNLNAVDREDLAAPGYHQSVRIAVIRDAPHARLGKIHDEAAGRIGRERGDQLVGRFNGAATAIYLGIYLYRVILYQFSFTVIEGEVDGGKRPFESTGRIAGESDVIVPEGGILVAYRRHLHRILILLRKIEGHLA